MVPSVVPHVSHSDKESQRATDIDRDLATVMNTWPSLPEPLKAAILAMVMHVNIAGRVSNLGYVESVKTCLQLTGREDIFESPQLIL